MEGVNISIGVLVEDRFIDDERLGSFAGRFDAVHREATWETGDITKEGFECFV